MRFALPGYSLKSIGCGLLLGCATAIPATAANGGQDTATREFQKTVPLAAGQTFSIESKFGEVRIHGENSREATISATIRAQASSHAEAEKYAEAVRVEVQQDAHGVSVRTVAPSDGPFVIRIGHKNSYSVDYDIGVPVDAKLWMKNAFGNVDIRGVHGPSEVENSHGQLAMHDGGSAKLTNAFGTIEAEDLAGDLGVANNNGTVSVSTVQGSVDVRTVSARSPSKMCKEA